MLKPLKATATALPKDRAARHGRTFLHQLTSGIAGWLTFEQMQKAVDNLREGELAKPLEMIARGRGFEVKGEFPLQPPERRPGGPARVDFVLVHRTRRIVIAIETKYKKKGKRMAGSLAADARRLRNLTIDALQTQIDAGLGGPIKESIQGYELVRAVMIVWHRSDVMEQLFREPTVIISQFLDLVAALLPEGTEASARNFAEAMVGVLPIRPVARKSGALRAGSTFTHKRFWVACLFEQSNWSRL